MNNYLMGGVYGAINNCLLTLTFDKDPNGISGDTWWHTGLIGFGGGVLGVALVAYMFPDAGALTQFAAAFGGVLLYDNFLFSV